MGLSKFGTGDGEWQFRALRGGAAEAHALERPLDCPAAVGETVEKRVLICDCIDQNGALLARNDVLHQCEGMRRCCRKYWTDVARGAAVADQRHRIAAGNETRG